MTDTPKQLSQDEDMIDLRQILSILLDNKYIILGFILLFGILGYFYLQGQKPIYQANALIQIEPKSGGGLAGLSGITGVFEESSGVEAEVEILKSRFVLGKVVDEQALRLRAMPKYFPLGRYVPGLNNYLVAEYAKDENNLFRYFGIDLTRFNTTDAAIQTEQFNIPEAALFDEEKFSFKKLTLKVTSDKTYDLYDDSGKHLLSGSFGLISFSHDGQIMLSIRAEGVHPGAEFTLFLQRRVAAIKSLRGRLKIKEQGGKKQWRSTGVLSIELEGTNRDQIQTTLNSVIQAYQNQNVQRQSEEAQRSIEFLESQIPTIKQDLETAENATNQYRAQSSGVDMQLETQAILNKIVAIEGKLSESRLKETELSTRFKKDHPVYATLLKQRRKLVSEQEAVNQEIKKLPAKQQELLRLMRDVEVTNAVYLQLLNKMEELKVARAGTVGNVRILDEAEVMGKPVKPRKHLIIIIALVAGGLSGLVFVFLRTWLNPGLINPLEIQDKLHLVNYGAIPISYEQRQINKGTISSKDPAILAAIEPKAPTLEAVRSIRTSLHFAMLEATNNLVMLTSPAPDAGKSFIASNLAVLTAQAQNDQKILLIDMDMRRGYIHESMHVDRAPGLSNILSEGLKLEQATHTNVVSNLDFIATGDIPPNPSELIMSHAFTEFIEEVQLTYDIVFIDTPPVLAVTDAALIGRQMGTSLLVVRHKVNTLNEVQQTKKELENLKVTLKGYIYNFIELKKSYNYYRNYYYYEYDKK